MEQDEWQEVDLEALDPTPDIHALFVHYNELYFGGQLGACSVEWSSKRMTMCAGQCHYSRTGGCIIRLSEPLLKFRPTADLKETLLHEMIHASLFLKGVREGNGGHGPRFCAQMTAINQSSAADPQRPPGGYNVTVYHTMIDEVNNYRTHVWQCDRCGNVVRRASNRPPQEADCRHYSKAKAAAAAAQRVPYCQDARCWYHGHVSSCGGAYAKISEPDKAARGQPAGGTAKSSSSSSSSVEHSKRGSSSKKPVSAAAAAAQGFRSIDSFFGKHNAEKQEQQAGSSAGGGTQQQQQQQQQQGGSSQSAPPRRADPRAAAAAAAIARAAATAGAGGGAGGVASGDPAAPGAGGQHVPACDVVELLSSDEDDDGDDDGHDGRGDAGAAAAGAQRHARQQQQQQQQVLMCPVCCAEFDALAALNAHLDTCLAR